MARYPAAAHAAPRHVSSAARLVRAGELDADTLGRWTRRAPSRRCTQPLAAFSYYVVAPKGWGQMVSGRGWKEIAALPWIWTPPDSVHHRLLARKFAELDAVPNAVAGSTRRHPCWIWCARAWACRWRATRWPARIADARPAAGAGTGDPHRAVLRLPGLAQRGTAGGGRLRRGARGLLLIWQPRVARSGQRARYRTADMTPRK